MLSAFCQGTRASSPSKAEQQNAGSETLLRVFKPLILSRLAETEELETLAGVCFLTALFQVDWESASLVFQDPAIFELVTDALDLFPHSTTVSLEIALLLSQAGGHKTSRSMIASQQVEWLQNQASQSKDVSLRAASTVALVKLSRGRANDSELEIADTHFGSHRDEELYKMMKVIIIDGGDSSSLGNAIEGLAYLTADPSVRESIASDPELLSRIFSLVPLKRSNSQTTDPKDATLIFGILVIISNICSYRPRLTEEQSQIEKLRKMASAGKGSTQLSRSSQTDELTDDDHVKWRIRNLLSAGVLDVLTTAVRRAESPGIRLNAGKILLDIVEDSENRGKVLQGGGAKTLRLIIRQSTSGLPETPQQRPNTTLGLEDLRPIQALAKLAITASPLQVFGPSRDACFDAIRPFSLMLLHPSSTLLQRFEAIMALTNLSSQGEETSMRIADTDGLMNQIELLLLEDHTLIRRAAMELLCNLIAGSESTFDRYGGSENMERTKSKLHILLALSDVDDIKTRLAASGALAVLTQAPSACHGLRLLQDEQQRVLPILIELICPPTECSVDHTDERDSESKVTDSGLVDRGVVCVRNLLCVSNPDDRSKLITQGEKAGLKEALLGAVKSNPGGAVLRPIAEALQYFTGK